MRDKVIFYPHVVPNCELNRGFGMGRVNIVKQVKVDGKCTLLSILNKKSGHYDGAALPYGDYFVEWRED